MKRITANLLLERHKSLDAAVVAVLAGVALILTLVGSDRGGLSLDSRLVLYGTLIAAASALLGFVVAALSIVVALPSTERLDALKRHPRWQLIACMFASTARLLIVAIAMSAFGIFIDHGSSSVNLYEAVTLGIWIFTLVRLVGVTIALEQILRVAHIRSPLPTQTSDPGP